MSEITTKEAGELLGVDEATVRKWCLAGKIPARRIGGHRGLWLVDSEGLENVKRSNAGKKAVRKPKLKLGD